MPQRLLRNSTIKVSEALQMAIMELANMRKSVVISEFILMALVEQKDSIVLKVFDELGLDTGTIRSSLVDLVLAKTQGLDDVDPRFAGSMQITKDVQNLFLAADEERKKFKDGYISTGAMFLACFHESVPGTKEILEQQGLLYDQCRRALETIRGKIKVDQKDSESRQTTLDQYTTDITHMARKGLLDPVIGRENEIKRVIEIISRRKKNNPVLIGEPGVGKTVIVEGLAQQIVAADVPEYLINKRILSLEMGTLIAGAKVQGEFEERLKKIVDEVVAASGDIMLFIDELHTVVGAGKTGGGLDASNMLKPALARGLLQCMGATTLKEYKQYIESDKALERRFQPVKIEQPSVEQTIKILYGLKGQYAAHHQIEYTDEAIRAAAELSDRYLTERHLPDKAIDLIDEAGAAKRLKVIYTPPELRALEAKRQDLAEQKKQAFVDQDFERMAKFQMQLSGLEQEMRIKRKEFEDTFDEKDRQVGQNDIAKVVSRMTGIPVQKMVAAEADILLNLKDVLSKRVVGQEHAVASVSDAILRNRAGLRQANRPVASFLFLGPTGVGKTEMAKALTEQLMDDESKIIRIDMSEYMEKHTVSKLIGSPPGYVGFGEGGQLTEKVKQKPYSIILFDEFEKAHPDVFNILLQVLDEGWLTDSEGQKVSFRNCVIIGTSNIGSEILTDRKRPVGIGAQTEDWGKDEEQKAIREEVKKYLRPEFINRLDEIIVFNRLGKEELTQILDLLVNDLKNRLAKQNLQLDFTASAKKLLLSEIDTNQFGARPLRRRLEQRVENKVAMKLIKNKAGHFSKIVVDAKKDQITVNLLTASA